MILHIVEDYQIEMVPHWMIYVYGQKIGERNANNLLDTCVYIEEYLYGGRVELITNIIADAIYKSMDLDGDKFLMFKVILDHRNDVAATSKGNGCYNVRIVILIRRKTKRGWICHSNTKTAQSPGPS